MSRLDELIEKLCPDGVEYKTLEQCCCILDKKRKPVTKSSRISGEYPYYGANGIQDYVSNYIFEGEFVLVGEDGSVITDKGTPVVTWASGKIWVNNHAHIISEIGEVLLRYLYHYLQTVDVTFYIHGNIPKLTGKDFKSIKIPVPPLEVQAEIVRILDNFTELEMELEMELELRRKQYEYYRNLLLDFKDVHAGGTNAYSVPWLADMLHELCPEGVEYKTLGEVAVKISDGMHNLPKGIREFGKYPILSAQNVNKGMIFTETSKWVNREIFEIENRRTNVQKGDVLLTIVGAIGRTAVVEGELQALFQRSICVIKPDIKLINSRYIAYCLDSTDIQNYMTSNAHGAAQKGLYLKQVSEIKLPVPPLAVQQRIVDILDRFDALCNVLTSGLPAEIALRRKQYEYYRDKLLSFKQLKEA